MLHQELLVYRQDLSSGSMAVLRQGMALLHAFFLWDRIFLKHRQEVEQQYLDLVFAIYTLFRQLPDVEEHDGRFQGAVVAQWLQVLLGRVRSQDSIPSLSNS